MLEITLISMNTLDLYTAEFGKPETLRGFELENALEHRQFSQAVFTASGTLLPAYPIFDIDPNNFDDWLQLHAQVHQAEATALGLPYPSWILDVNFDVESEFYDWIGNHAALHQLTIDTLGLTS